MGINEQVQKPYGYRSNPRKDFDSIAGIARGSIRVSHARDENLPEALALVKRHIPVQLTNLDAVREVMDYNRDNIHLIWRDHKLVGVYAMLMLNHIGLERLLLDELEVLTPDRACLAMGMATPSAIYKWAVVAPAMASHAICQISHILQKPRYSHANLYARPATMAGRRIMENLGFEHIPAVMPDLYRYERAGIKSKISPAKIELQQVA